MKVSALVANISFVFLVFFCRVKKFCYICNRKGVPEYVWSRGEAS